MKSDGDGMENSYGGLEPLKTADFLKYSRTLPKSTPVLAH